MDILEINLNLTFLIDFLTKNKIDLDLIIDFKADTNTIKIESLKDQKLKIDQMII